MKIRYWLTTIGAWFVLIATCVLIVYSMKMLVRFAFAQEPAQPIPPQGTFPIEGGTQLRKAKAADCEALNGLLIFRPRKMDGVIEWWCLYLEPEPKEPKSENSDL